MCGRTFSTRDHAFFEKMHFLIYDILIKVTSFKGYYKFNKSYISDIKNKNQVSNFNIIELLVQFVQRIKG